MALPKVQPSGGTPTTQDFISLQTQWAMQLDPLVDPISIENVVLIGTILMWGAMTAPANYLLCNGKTVLQSQYKKLFLAIGTNFNTGGEPAGSFRLPPASGPFTLIIKFAP